MVILSASLRRLVIAAVICLLCHQQVTCGMLLFEDEPEPLPCPREQLNNIQLAPECHLLKLFNQSLVEEMKMDNLTNFKQLLDRCSCNLISLRNLWESYYDTDLVRRVFVMVDRTIEQYLLNPSGDQFEPVLPAELLQSQSRKEDLPGSQLDNYPPFLWSDIDVTFYGISIHTATSDYFQKVIAGNPFFKLKKALGKTLSSHATWMTIQQVCFKITLDPHKLYRYLENLNRLSPLAFSRTLLKYEVIDMTYQASKACKLLLLPKLNAYKLKPDNSQLVSISDSPLKEEEDSSMFSRRVEDLQNVHEQEELLNYRDDLDVMLNSASGYLLNCREWQARKNSLKELEVECPMMMSEGSRGIPSDWLFNHSTALSRSQTAVKCACQLLLHNSTWATIMLDKNVQIMATALTNYLNENRIPDFSTAPIMSLFGWFQHVMERFENRKMSIKEIMKVKYRDQDPTIVMKHDTYDESLELLRRGCNYIMFNYNKGSPEAASELKLIRYLDNLQTISRDPMFVFHLSLQDPNLFKLNALSKMCKPIVS